MKLLETVLLLIIITLLVSCDFESYEREKYLSVEVGDSLYMGTSEESWWVHIGKLDKVEIRPSRKLK